MNHNQLEEVIFGKTGFRRFTQDSPILPDVWMAYGLEPSAQMDLLLTPTWGIGPGKISKAIDERLEVEQKTSRWKAMPGREKALSPEIAYNVSTVAVRLYFDEMIRVVLPMTKWWDTYILEDGGKSFSQVVNSKAFRDKLSVALSGPDKDSKGASARDQVWDLNGAMKHKVWGRQKPKRLEHLVWLIKIVGAIAFAGPSETCNNILNDVPAIINAFAELMKDSVPVNKDENGLVWAINLNRPASAMIWQSTTAVKADAARRLFEVSCKDIRWAIIDSGIDATHPAFRIRDAAGIPAKNPFNSDEGAQENMTRVERTYDFTLIRKILSRDKATFEQLPPRIQKRFKDKPEEKQAFQKRLQNGFAVDWETLAPCLEIPHTRKDYRPPVFEHGTHVAGILAADWRGKEKTNEKKIDIRGVCPDLRLYDLRVLDENGLSDEFSILAAMQFVNYLNTNSEHLTLHGVNLSLSIRHKVKNFACGCTPVCEEAERLVSAGLIVVAAAGNDGYLESELGGGLSEGYRSISITDPGNAQGVITVGATHRDSPHTYGVSYFSSRGPTGDGRIKPDLVAPGEKITSTVPDIGLKAMDGTSMAAPHVSGAAALLIARYRELIGRPARVKQILCDTATDLGRERYFQGSGMVDILRAMQSV
ncbi:MAG TPA: S8 family peptidase [Pyrinomonadaceae bacterium]|nr:S8 family peptidase [Pyrinomonadaceae bacterium]